MQYDFESRKIGEVSFYRVFETRCRRETIALCPTVDMATLVIKALNNDNAQNNAQYLAKKEEEIDDLNERISELKAEILNLDKPERVIEAAFSADPYQ